MRGAVIQQSPHAVNPKQQLTEEERSKLCRTRLDDTFRPYTVVDVLTGVYHRCFKDDLGKYIAQRPEEFIALEKGWKVSGSRVNECRISRVEALFFQPISDFVVELCAHADLSMELVRTEYMDAKRIKRVRLDVRLRYCLDLRPCKLTCVFEKVVVNEADSLLASYPGEIRADKYLLPVLQEADYPRLAKQLLKGYGLSPKDIPLKADELVRQMGLTLRYGRFPENGVMGEIYFNYGHAELINPVTGEVRDTNIRPSTIVMNAAACANRGMYNVTLLHECSHHLLAVKHFLLQMMHGHQFCSYLCKRKDIRQQVDQLSPVDIMEIQANKLPGYLLIEAESGKTIAEKFLRTYPDRSIMGMQRLVRDIAEYYGTTQTVARTRLQAMGYTGVRGILQSANGELVPAYLSDLKDGQTYTISHIDAMKEYVFNPAFRAVLDSGRYIYCEGHFCLNDARYIRADHMGYIHLSIYARGHMAECCLIFETLYDSAWRRLFNGVLQKGRGGRRQIKYVKGNGESPVTEEGRKFQRMIANEYNEAAKFRASFQDMLVRLMDIRSMTIGQLAGAAGLSIETIKNMRNDPERQFAIEPIIAVCIALHLSPDLSSQLIESSPAKFQRSEEMSAYRYALNHCYTWEVPKVNRLLVEAGYHPLTDLVDGYSEDGVKLES